METLDDSEMKELAALAKTIRHDFRDAVGESLEARIVRSLGCDANGVGVPCRTDRLAALDDMRKYLERGSTHKAVARFVKVHEPRAARVIPFTPLTGAALYERSVKELRARLGSTIDSPEAKAFLANLKTRTDALAPEHLVSIARGDALNKTAAGQLGYAVAALVQSGASEADVLGTVRALFALYA